MILKGIGVHDTQNFCHLLKVSLIRFVDLLCVFVFLQLEELDISGNPIRAFDTLKGMPHLQVECAELNIEAPC